MTVDLSVYLVADPAACGSRGVADTVAAAVQGGVSAVQLRDKDASAQSLYALATRVREVLEGSGVPLVVNDRLDVALASGADGVHLGQSDLPVEHVRRLGGPDLLVGLSVSTATEVDAANALPPGMVDYLGVGPVFTTPTKPDAADALGVDGLGELCGRADLPCVAIGGIHAGNAAALWAVGVDGLAVVSAICGAHDPAAAVGELARSAS